MGATNLTKKILMFTFIALIEIVMAILIVSTLKVSIEKVNLNNYELTKKEIGVYRIFRCLEVEEGNINGLGTIDLEKLNNPETRNCLGKEPYLIILKEKNDSEYKEVGKLSKPGVTEKVLEQEVIIKKGNEYVEGEIIIEK